MKKVPAEHLQAIPRDTCCLADNVRLVKKKPFRPDGRFDDRVQKVPSAAANIYDSWDDSNRSANNQRYDSLRFCSHRAVEFRNVLRVIFEVAPESSFGGVVTHRIPGGHRFIQPYR